MANSLQDQLLSSGLIDKKQLEKAKSEQRKKNRRKTKSGHAQAAGNKAAKLRKAAEESKKRDRELNLKRRQAEEKRARKAEVRELISAHRIAIEQGEIAYNFEDQGKIKKLYLDQEGRGKILRGLWSIVRLDRQYVVVPSTIAEKIGKRDPHAVVGQNTAGSKESDESDYPDHQVPDDLIW